MEKVKEALAKARLEREQTLEGVSNVSSSQTKSVQSIARKSPENLEFTYTETQIIDVDVEYWKRNRIITDTDSSPNGAEAYKVLRTRLLQRMRTNDWNSIAITSPTTGNGKTLTAINLAISFARESNQTVLLVDLDLRRPKISKYLFRQSLPGISDYLMNDDVELGDLLINPGINRLVVLPGDDSFTHSSEMLSSPKMVSLIKEIKTRYPSRIIIFDLPPILACDDLLAFSPQVDSTLLVLEEGKTKKHDLKRAVELLENTNNFMGWIMNKSREKSSGYGYYGYYGYN